MGSGDIRTFSTTPQQGDSEPMKPIGMFSDLAVHTSNQHEHGQMKLSLDGGNSAIINDNQSNISSTTTSPSLASQPMEENKMEILSQNIHVSSRLGNKSGIALAKPGTQRTKIK